MKDLMTLFPRFHFGCSVVDPAWSFNDKGSRIAPDEKRPTPLFPNEVRHYETMSLDDICSLPVGYLMAPRSHLYLWCPATLLFTHVPPVLDAWGFDYKTLVSWRKMTRKPPLELLIRALIEKGENVTPHELKRALDGSAKQHFGAGHFFRGGVEYCVFATRGGCPANVRNERAIFDAAVGRHSQKPEKLQDIAERVSPGPYIELFARRIRKGWSAWGYEVPELVENAS